MKPYLIIAATVALAASRPLGAAPTVDDAKTPAAQSESSNSFDPQKVLPPQDLTEEQESNRSELEGVLRAAREPLDEAAARAALANWLLAVPTARPVTRWLIGAGSTEDRKAIAEAAKAAQSHLTAAAELLKKADPADSTEKARVRRLSTAIKGLQAFTTALAAAGLEGDDAARREAWSSAAAALAESRESENSSLASAATLWQAIAWDQSGRRDRALSTLPGGLAKPDYNTDFLARIVRCRMLSDAGQSTAALALASQLRMKIDEWYKDETATQRRARQRLIGALQLTIGQAWKQKLAAVTQPADAEILDGLLVGVQQGLFPAADKAPSVFIPAEMLPTLAKPPAIKPTSAEPNEKPATTPTD